MPDDDSVDASWFPWRGYADGLRTGVRNNSSAYSNSVLATVGFAVVSSRVGAPSLGDLFWFVAGASIGFTAVEAAASRGFRDELRGDRSAVVVIGSAINLASIAAGLGAVIAVVTAAAGWVAWLAASFVGTVVYAIQVTAATSSSAPSSWAVWSRAAARRPGPRDRAPRSLCRDHEGRRPRSPTSGGLAWP